MKLKPSKIQIMILIIAGVIGALRGYSYRPIYICIKAPCPSPSSIPYMLTGLIICLAIVYLLEIAYNNLIKSYSKNKNHGYYCHCPDRCMKSGRKTQKQSKQSIMFKSFIFYKKA